MYIIVIGFFATLYKYFDFSVVNNVTYLNEVCQESWWRNILYISNFYPEDVPVVSSINSSIYVVLV